MKRILLLFSALMLSCIALWAHDVVIDGIYYDLDETKKTAGVTYRGGDYDDYDDEYSGSVTIPETITYNSEIYSVTYIDERAFYDCSRLTEVTIPNSVTYIGFFAFFGCSGLTKVNYLGTVDKWVDIDIYINSSFEDYSNPTYYAEDLYINNELLTDVKITTADAIKKDAFHNCQSIKSVEIGNSVTSIGENAFSGCSGLTSVTIPNSVTSIGWDAFEGCSGLTSVTIPNSVTSIGEDAFYSTGIYKNNSNWDNGVLYIDNCLIKAKSDVVKGSYTIKKGTRIIGDRAFEYCSGLTSVTIPNSVTSIGQDAFVECSGLTSVTIGNSVTSIGQYAFSGCDKLRKVTAYPTTVPNVYENSFAHYNAVLYVPCNVYDDYLFDDVFFTFKVIECIAAEEDEPTSITENLADANITVSGGTISADADFSIYNTIGQDVTAFNGSLQPGVYLVSIENNIVKVMVH